MKTVIKKVYYCDFCNKRGLGAGQMNKHELHCTNNPKRECRVCESEEIEGKLKGLVDYYKSLFELVMNIPANRIGHMAEWLEHTEDSHFVKWAVEKPPTMEELRLSVNNCPMCLFALIRQVGFNKHYFHDAYKFEYKEEVGAAMQAKIIRHELPF